jgi:hypothetical protein
MVLDDPLLLMYVLLCVCCSNDTAMATAAAAAACSDLLFSVQEQLAEDTKQRIADLMAMETNSTWTLVSHAAQQWNPLPVALACHVHCACCLCTVLNGTRLITPVTCACSWHSITSPLHLMKKFPDY